MVLLLSLIQAWGRAFPAHVAHTNAATCERVLSCWTPLLRHHLLRLVGALYVRHSCTLPTCNLAPNVLVLDQGWLRWESTGGGPATRWASPR